MNIIIPIGGLGERFKQVGYIQPKPLVKALGDSIINLLFNKLVLSQEDKVFIFYNAELDKFNFKDILKFKNKNLNLFFIKIDFKTRGASETLLCGINQIPKTLLSDELTLCLDCDTFYEDDIISSCKKNNDNLIFYFKDNQDKPIYSYIKIKNDKVIEIKEKIKISDNANVGAYCFKNLSMLKKYCEKLVNQPLSTEQKEYYISSVYNLMLKDDIKIYAQKVESFNCLGTPEQLEVYCLKNKNNTSNKRFCFDLDNTLVTYPEIEGDYSSVKPILKNIEYLKFLKSLGHTIIIHTARRMRTHKGNVSAVIQDIGEVTFDTLKKFNIPYDEIYFGKPYADYYIDDLAVNPYENLEKSTGFYQENIQPRDFNSIEVKKDSILKKSDNPKISGEIFWYKYLQNNKLKIKKYFPTLISCEKNSLEIEKIDGVTASQLFVNSSMTSQNLIDILNALDDIHNHKKIKKEDIYKNYSQKLQLRYKDYNYSYLKNANTIYNDLLDFLKSYEKNDLGKIGAIHGDPVFTNILINKNNEIKFIDMRGVLGDSITIAGDIFYDYAKIFQSIIGYDNILLEKPINKEYQEDFKQLFSNFIIKKYNKETFNNIKMLTNSLLFSLIPLHKNEKSQKYIDLINI